MNKKQTKGLQEKRAAARPAAKSTRQQTLTELAISQTGQVPQTDAADKSEEPREGPEI